MNVCSILAPLTLTAMEGDSFNCTWQVVRYIGVETVPVEIGSSVLRSVMRYHGPGGDMAPDSFDATASGSMLTLKLPSDNVLSASQYAFEIDAELPSGRTTLAYGTLKVLPTLFA